VFSFALSKYFTRSCLSALLGCLMITMACSQDARGATSGDDNSAITTFDVPDANAAMYRGTVAIAIDNAGDVAGVYSDVNNAIHAYVRSAAGTIAEFDGPPVKGAAVQETIPIGFDATGDLAGIYIDSTGKTHGFIRTASGLVTSIDVVISGSTTVVDTIPTFIDAAGDVSGVYEDSNQITHAFLLPFGGTLITFDPANVNNGTGGTSPGTDYVTVDPTAGAAGTYVDVNDVIHGFIRSSNGTITTVDAPGASAGAGRGTAVYAIGSTGIVGGLYIDSKGVAHGFVRSASGTFSTFDAPVVGSGTGQSPGIFPFSYPFGFDAMGDFSGVYLDSNDVVYGFVRSPSGTITTFTAPDAAPMPASLKRTIARLSRQTKIGKKARGFAQRRLGIHSGMASADTRKNDLLAEVSITGNLPSEIQGTAGLAISATGEITGIYTDSEAGIHSFVRTPGGGSITEFSVPDAGDGVYQGTVAFAINSSGTIAGTYLDSSSVLHGFVATLAQVATTTKLTFEPSSAVYGQPVTLTAVITSGSNPVPDSETVQFTTGTTSIGSAAISNNTATLTTTLLPVAMDTVTAAYAGDTNFAGSLSNSVTVPVATATTSTKLTSSLNPSTTGQSVTFTARVTGAYGGTATGTVTFSNGTTVLDSAPLTGNSATFTSSSLGAGTDPITATYGGDSNFQSSTSDTVNQVVSGALVPDFSLTSTPATLSLQSGGQGTVTVTVTPTNGFSSAVTFACSGLPSGASCAFNPATVTPAGAAATTTLTIATGSASAFAHPNSSGFLPEATVALGVCLIGWKRRRRILSLLVLSVAGVLLFSGCGGGSKSNPPPPPVTSTVTVTATSGSIQQTTTVSLTVN
jgi:hypothetical protein